MDTTLHSVNALRSPETRTCTDLLSCYHEKQAIITLLAQFNAGLNHRVSANPGKLIVTQLRRRVNPAGCFLLASAWL